MEGFDEDVQEETGIKVLDTSDSKNYNAEIDATDRVLDFDLSDLEPEQGQGLQQ